MKDKIRLVFNTLKTFLFEVSTEKNLRAPYIVCEDPVKKAGLFSRKRVWTFNLLVLAIMSCFKRTLSVEIIKFLDSAGCPQTTPEAYVKRRGFISSELFRDANNLFLKAAYDNGVFRTWRNGKYLCGIDGTRLSLPYTPALYKKYRGRTDRGHNLGRGVFVTDLVNRAIVSSDLRPNKTEERKAALELLKEHAFPMDLKQTVFVMDRGYPGLRLMNWFHAKTGGFIIRARRDTNCEIAKFMDSGEMEKTVELKLSRNRSGLGKTKPEPMKVRLVRRPRLKGEKEPVVYITDLDATAWPADVIREAYRMRWNVETEIGTAKNELQIEIVSGNREICVLQDFFSAILLYNMETLLRTQANHKLRTKRTRKRYQVDMNCTWAIMQEVVADLFVPPEKFDEKLTFCIKIFLRCLSIERPGRHYPRNKRTIKIEGKFMPLTNYKRGL